jgi:hypothetical protein
LLRSGSAENENPAGQPGFSPETFFIPLAAVPRMERYAREVSARAIPSHLPKPNPPFDYEPS